MAPTFFRKIRIDPAVASGPFVTTANDITGILIYLGTATVEVNEEAGPSVGRLRFLAGVQGLIFLAQFLYLREQVPQLSFKPLQIVICLF